jgi:PPM family protein phosphatase
MLELILRGIFTSMFENVRHFEKSDIGLLRHSNEDSFLIVGRDGPHDDLQRSGMIFIVADGLGGHAAGEIASRMACEETVSAYYGDDLISQNHADAGESKVRKLENAIWSAHEKIINLATGNVEWRRMGTTLSVLVLTDGNALIAHVGDSRIYRCRNRSCERMTVDHRERQTPIGIGPIQQDQETHHGCGHIITQVLGGYDDLDTIYTRVENVQRGDIFLLCTDGLHDLVTDHEIQEILAEKSLPQTACEELVQAAIRNGGRDNVTVIVVQV